jgi:hypothetical protein
MLDQSKPSNAAAQAALDVAPTEYRLRLRLRHAGVDPLPLNGKRPPLKEWHKKIDSSDDEIRLLRRLSPYATNTGVLTWLAPAIDILNPEAAEAVEELARDRFEEQGSVPRREDSLASPLVIVVSSTKSAGHFQARLQHSNEVLVKNSRQPFLDGARLLVERGYDPSALLVMKHLGSDIVALRAPLGKASKLTVEEGPHGPRFVGFRTDLKTRVAAPPIAPSVGTLPNLPESNSLTGAPATRETDDVG